MSTTLVPDCTGLNIYPATEAIAAAGLLIGNTTYTYSATVPLTSVISQSPAALAAVPFSTIVYLTVSLGPQPPVVTVVVP